MKQPRVSVLFRVAASVLVVALGLLTVQRTTQASTAKAPTIHLVFGTQGLGPEGDASRAQVTAFEKKYPNIKVTIDTHSAQANDAYTAYVTTLASGASTPDVINSDVTWPAIFGSAGFITPLNKFHVNQKSFFPGIMASGVYQGKVYAVPWFINAEGLYYRKDLIKKVPKTTAQLVTLTKAAMTKGAKYGIVFEANKYEGLVTNYINWLGGFGGSILDKKGRTVVNSKAGVKALTFMIDMVNKYKIAPAAVTGWNEGNVQTAFLNGDAATSVNWPYIFALAEAKGSKIKGKVGWTTIPTSGGQPTACLGGSVLIMNAKSHNQAAAWKFIQFLASKPQQIYRGKAAGDPPALKAAYGKALYKAASYYKQEKAVYNHVVSRPVSSKYLKVSAVLQNELSSAFSGQVTPKAALNSAASQIKKILGK